MRVHSPTVAALANDAGKAALADKTENRDLSFLPKALTVQYQSLIESYHEPHGYACLPNMLWKVRLRPFIQAHRELRQLLKKASTTRRAKKSNEGFVRIATTILSLEILASSFAGWSAIYPEAGLMAQAILKRNARSPHMALMEFYLLYLRHFLVDFIHIPHAELLQSVARQIVDRRVLHLYVRV
jgi:hypothetical protein